MEEFVALVKDGGAVDPESVKNRLPRAENIAFVERNGRMVAVAAVKRASPDYAVRLSTRSGFKLNANTPELGYIVVSEECRGLHLSTKVVKRILAESSGPLFATTSDHKMKCILANNGFRWVGQPWDGKRSGEKLSLWIREE